MRSAALLYVGLSLLQRALSLLLLPFVTRSMDTSQYGAVSLLTSVGGLLALVLGGALEQAVYRWSVSHKSRDNAAEILWLSAFWLRVGLPLLGSAAAAVLWFAQGSVLKVDNKLWAIEVLATVLAASATYLALPSLRAREKLRTFAVLAVAGILTMLVTKIWFVMLLGWGAYGWVISDLSAGVVTYVAGLVLVRIARTRSAASSLKVLLTFALPLVPHLATFWALGALTRPLMVLSLPLSAVGTFAAAFNIANVGVLIVAEVNRAMAVQYARDSLPGPSDATSRIARLQFVLALLTPTVLSAGLCIAGPLLLPAEYWGSISLVGPLSFLALGYGVYLVPMNLLTQTAGRTSKSWVASALGAGLIFATTNGLAVAFGVTGVAWANVAGYSIMAASAFLIVRLEKLDIRWSKAVPSPATIAILLVLSGLTCAWCSFSTPGVASALGGMVLLVLATIAVAVALRRTR